MHDDIKTLFLLQQAAILGKITEVFIDYGQLIDCSFITVVEIS